MLDYILIIVACIIKQIPDVINIVYKKAEIMKFILIKQKIRIYPTGFKF